MKIVQALGLGAALASGVASPSRATIAMPPPPPPVCTVLPALPASAPPKARAYDGQVAGLQWSACRREGDLAYRAVLLQRTGEVCRLRWRATWWDPDPRDPPEPDVWGGAPVHLWRGAGPCPDLQPPSPYDQVNPIYVQANAELRDTEFVRVLNLVEGLKVSPWSHAHGGPPLEPMTQRERTELDQALVRVRVSTIWRRSWLFGLCRFYTVFVDGVDYGRDYRIQVGELFGHVWIRQIQTYQMIT